MAAHREASQVAGTDPAEDRHALGGPRLLCSTRRSCSGIHLCQCSCHHQCTITAPNSPVCSVPPTPESHKPGLPLGQSMARRELGAAARPPVPSSLASPTAVESGSTTQPSRGNTGRKPHLWWKIQQNFPSLPGKKTARKTGQEKSFSIQDLNQTRPQQWRQRQGVRSPCVLGCTFPVAHKPQGPQSYTLWSPVGHHVLLPKATLSHPAAGSRVFCS